MMNQINNETTDILFADDYLGLIEKLVVDVGQNELIESLTKKYKAKNPSFLVKLKKAACFKAVEENGKWHNIKLIDNEESAILEEITSSTFQNNVSEFTIQQAQVKVIKIEADNSEEDSLDFWLPYARLYLNVLFCIVQDKEKIEEEDPFNLLSTKEKLYLLEQLISNEKLKDIKHSKLLEVTLSLITGIKMVSIEKPLKEYKDWFNPYPNHSPTSLQSRIESLNKIEEILKSQGIINDELISSLETAISIFEVEKTSKEKKKAKEKEDNRNKLSKKL